MKLSFESGNTDASLNFLSNKILWPRSNFIRIDFWENYLAIYSIYIEVYYEV